MRPPKSFFFGPLVAPLFILARRGAVIEMIAIASPLQLCFVWCLNASFPKCESEKNRRPRPPFG
jgi:hypothetical protein